MDFSESIPDLSAIEAELQSHAPDSFLLVLPKKICQNRYSQWCDLLFETLRHPSITLRYGVSAKVLGESIYDKSSGKIYILGIKNVSNTKVWMKFNEITNNEKIKRHKDVKNSYVAPLNVTTTQNTKFNLKLPYTTNIC